MISVPIPISRFVPINFNVLFKGDTVRSLLKNISIAVIVVTPISVLSSPNIVLKITTNTITNINMAVLVIIAFLFIIIAS